jgi:hypothetical protein
LRHRALLTELTRLAVIGAGVKSGANAAAKKQIF